MTKSTLRVFRPSAAPGNNWTNFDPRKIFSRLGLKANTREDLVAEIRRGLSVNVIDKLVMELAVSQKTLLQVITLPSATLTRRRSQKRLTPQESDRVYRVAAAYRSALELFEGDSDAARHWLTEPAKALGGITPLAHLDTEAGADDVQDLIGRLERGVIT